MTANLITSRPDASIASSATTLTPTALRGITHTAGGTVVPTARVSDANGFATVDSWILGSIAGTNKLSAPVSKASYVDFGANGT